MGGSALPSLCRAACAAVVACALLAAPAFAVPVPELAAHVTDLTGTLPPDRVAALEQRLAALEQRKGSQFLVLVVPTTQPETIEQFSLRVAEQNRIGRENADDGLLLLVAKDDRKARIEVGYGLEGVVTDAISSRVIREYLAPRFREGDYAGGLDEATAVLEKLVDGEPLPPPMAAQDTGDANSPFLPIVIGLFVGMFAAGTRLRPVTLRRLGAGGVAAAGAFLLLGSIGALAIAGIVAFLLSGARAVAGGRYIGHGGFGGGGFGGGGFGGGGGGFGGGGWSGGGGGFGGGGASGGW